MANRSKVVIAIATIFLIINLVLLAIDYQGISKSVSFIQIAICLITIFVVLHLYRQKSKESGEE